MNKFPSDFQNNLTGFGGDLAMNQARHRAAVNRTPVILVHGNAGHSAHRTWGMETMRSFLKKSGYQDCEIWAMDHLGENYDNGADLNEPHRNHIEAFRTFVDRVRAYLDVEKVDFIAHSLGCGMVNGYLRGLQGNGTWDHSQNRLDAVGTFVSLAAATYGFSRPKVKFLAANKEFTTGTEFEIASHEFKAVVDDTPRGTGDVSLQDAPDARWKAVTALDDSRICYVSLIAQGDFVDADNPNTGRREGACLNKRLVYEGSALARHERIIKDEIAFDTFKPYLNRLRPPVTITVDKDSGSYSSGLQISVTVEPPDTMVRYRAERVMKRVEVGYLVSTVAETRSGTLVDGQSLSLATDGVWEMSFEADGAAPVTRTYGLNVTMPEVTIVTDNSKPFSPPLEVVATTTLGTLYHGPDGEHWVVGATTTITQTETVWFVAIDASGAASTCVKRGFEPDPGYEDSQTATLTQHFNAGRLLVTDYVAIGLELGFNATLTLYLVKGKWVRNVPSRSVRARPVARMAAPHLPLVTADRPNGECAEGFDVTLTVSERGGARVRVFATRDGSDPSDESNPARESFTGQKTFTIEGNGPHSILCFTQDSLGNRSFESFAWSIDDRQYPETGIAPALGGTHSGRVEITLHPSEPCQWTRYTMDGSDPSTANALSYSPGEAIVLERSSVLKFCSKDLAGNVEPVKSATFVIVPAQTEAIFLNDDDKDGYVKADGRSTSAQVGTSRHLVVGTGRDGLDNRAFLHFDTSSLPDNAFVTHAHLELALHSLVGAPLAGDSALQVDVKNGYFGSSNALQAQDWNAAASAEGVAEIARTGTGMQCSGEFSEAGRKAINRAGPTQVRLRLNPAGAGNFAVLQEGTAARLIVQYVCDPELRGPSARRPTSKQVQPSE